MRNSLLVGSPYSGRSASLRTSRASWTALAGAAALFLSGCQCGPAEPGLTVTVTIDATVEATCAVLEVSSGGTVRLTQELKRPAGKNSWKVGLAKQQLPTDIKLLARSFKSASGAGCSEPRFQTSASAPVDAKFPAPGNVGTATVAIHAPAADLDADRDGHIATAKGGDDCNDALATVHPGLPAVCSSSVDNDCDGKGGCADSECSTAAVCNTPPTQLVFVTTAMPVNVNACSPALTVEAQSAANMPVNAASDTMVALTALPPNGVTLYSDSGCTTAVTNVTIPSGMARATFHFKAIAAGTFQATASILGLPTASQVQTVVQPMVTQLVFTTPARTVGVGGCSQALTLQTRDAAGMPAPVAAASSVSIGSSQAGVTFYADASCTTALTNSALPLAAGATGGSFYAKATSALATTVTATLTGVPPVTQMLTVVAGAPTQLAFATAAQGVQSGSCSNVVTVETRDMGNNVAAVTAATSVTLAATGVAITLYSDATCMTAITAPLPLAANASSVSFYFKGSVAGMATITATAPSLTSAMQVESVGVGAPAQLAFTSTAQTVTAGQCSGATTVQAQDMNGNPSNVTGMALPVTLGGPAMMFGLFSDANCMTAIAAPVNIPVGSNTATFYFRGTKAGPAVVTAAATGLTGAMQTETIGAAAPMALVFTSVVQSQPAAACAQFDLEARDAFGNPAAPASAVMVALTSTPAVAFGPSGCATTFTSVPLTGTTVSFFATSNAAGTKDLTATAPFGVAMQTYTVNAGPASKLGFTVQPTTAASGAALAPAVQVAVQDAFGNTVTSSTASITVAIASNPGSSVLSGTATVAAVAGVAAFATLSLDKVGTGYTLSASSAPLTAATSAAFDVTPGTPAALAFTVQPTNATAGAAIAPSVAVTIRDAAGNTVTSSTANVTLALGTNPGPGVLSGTATVPAVAGVATFPGMSINRAANGYTLQATSGALPAATSTAFDVAAGTPMQLSFGVQPSDATAGSAIAPAVTVRIEDAQGNLTASTATVSLALGANPGLSVLSGTASAAAVAGVATFSNLSLNKAANGYTLVASSGVLTGTTSTAFNVGAGSPTQLVFVTEPTNALAGDAISPAPSVSIEDANNNRVTTSTLSVTLAIGTNPGSSTLSGTATVAAVAGLVAFPGLSLNKTGTGYTLVASSGALATDTSAAFNIDPGAPASLSFSVQPTNVVSTNTLTPSPQVSILDANANLVNTSTLTIGLAIANNPSVGGTGVLSGTASVAAVAGVATFPGLSIDKVGTGYTLSATSGALTPGTSAAFNVTLGPASKLAILDTPLTVPALDCSAARTVQIQDNGGNPVNSVGNTVLNAYTAAPGGANTLFFANATCTTAQAAGNRTISNGTNSVVFYFSASVPTPTITITASVTGLMNGTQTATIAQATPTDLAFTTAAPTVEAGFCQALTLERQDRLGNPTSPTFATTVSLASNPATGISFFTNSTCTTPLAATFNINAGASSTVVYAKGTSGGLTATVVPTAQAYDLTASSTVPTPLNAGTLTVTVNPMVRRRNGACTLSGMTVNCAITPTLADTSRTFLVFQATPGNGDQNPTDDNVSCYLDPNAGTARVTCERVGTGGNVDIEWQTVSFPYSYANGGVTVEHLNGGCVGLALNAMPINVAIADRPTAERFVLFSTASTGNDNDFGDFFTAQLTSSTNLRISQSDASTTCNTSMSFRAQVVSWAGAAVNRGILAGGSAGPFTVSQSTAMGAPAFLLYSSRQVLTDTGSNNICRRRLRGDMNTTTLSFDRGCAGAGGDVQDISWEHVLLPTGASVQRVVGSMIDGVTTHTPSFTNAIDLTRSFAFTGGLGPGGAGSGRTDYAANDRVGAALARTRFTSTTQLNFARTSNSGASDWIGWVVQLTP